MADAVKQEPRLPLVVLRMHRVGALAVREGVPWAQTMLASLQGSLGVGPRHTVNAFLAHARCLLPSIPGSLFLRILDFHGGSLRSGRYRTVENAAYQWDVASHHLVVLLDADERVADEVLLHIEVGHVQGVLIILRLLEVAVVMLGDCDRPWH